MAHPLCIPRRAPHHPTDQACGSLKLGVQQVVPAHLQSLSFPAPSLVTHMEDGAPLFPWVFHSLLQPLFGLHYLHPHHLKSPSPLRVMFIPYLLRDSMR
jgi:hypothetical protein